MALLAVLGALACHLAIVPRAPAAAMASRLRRFTGVTLALLTLASFGILLSRLLEFTGGAWDQLPQAVWPALTVTHFGHVWRWRIPALVLAWLAWAWSARRTRSGAAWVLLLAVAAIALTRSETGHPADHGDFTLAVWVDWVHILAAGAWVGSLFGMSLAVFPALRRAGAHAIDEAARIFQRLSTLSGIALAVLLAAGIFNVTQQLGGVASLWTSRYGAALDVKLAIVLVMLLIGAHNRYIKLPQIRACAGLPRRPTLFGAWLRTHGAAIPDATVALRRCTRAVLIEGVLGLAAIGATATLVHQMPPTDMTSMPAMTASATHAATGPMGATPVSAAPR